MVYKCKIEDVEKFRSLLSLGNQGKNDNFSKYFYNFCFFDVKIFLTR